MIWSTCTMCRSAFVPPPLSNSVEGVVSIHGRPNPIRIRIELPVCSKIGIPILKNSLVGVLLMLLMRYTSGFWLVQVGGVMKLRIILRPEVASLRTSTDGTVHMSLEWLSLSVSAGVHGVLGQTYRPDFKGRL